MMEIPLRLNVPFQPGECAPEFAGRLAARNGIGLARHFCKDVGISFPALLDGCPAALGRLAEIADASPADVAAGSVRKQGPRLFLGSHRLTSAFFRRASFHVCPACLQEDVAASPLPPDASAYGRLVWHVIPVRTCATHGMALVDLGCGRSQSAQDFTAVVRPSLERLGGLAWGASLRQVSGLERYVMDRLDGRTGKVPFLDGLELHAAARFCEVLGACATYGRGLILERLSDDDWHLAGATGMTLAASGEEGLRRALVELRRTHPYGHRVKAGPRPPLAELRAWLTGAVRDPAYQPLRDFVDGFMAEGGAADIEGKRVRKSGRQLEFRAFPEATGSESARIHMRNVGANSPAPRRELIEMTNEQTNDEGASMPAGGHRLNLWEAVDHLACGMPLFQSLLTQGLLGRGGNEGATRGASFAVRDLDRLLAGVFADAVPVYEPRRDEAGIYETAAVLDVPEVEVVHLLLGRRLTRVGRLEDKRGLRSVLVHREEVRGHVAARSFLGLTLSRAAKRLRLKPEALSFLVEAGALRSERAVLTFSGCHAAAISKNALEAFEAEYVDWAGFCRELGVPPLKGWRTPKLREVQPAYLSEQLGVRFYRRSDIPHEARPA